MFACKMHAYPQLALSSSLSTSYKLS
jgi:hypothetical protein